MHKNKESDKNQSIVASIIILLTGIYVALSPIWLSMSNVGETSTVITGIIIALAGLVQLFWEVTLPSWISGLAAVWLFISAFTFSMSSAARWSQLLSAVAVFILSYWDGLEVAELHDYRAGRHAA
jgi:membrane-bound ClpP family serine protease